jgi:hypothetical protein
MTRIDFIRSAGRWLMLSVILSAAGLLLATRRISFRNYCGAKTNCAGCGLGRVCFPEDENKTKSDGEKEKL